MVITSILVTNVGVKCVHILPVTVVITQLCDNCPRWLHNIDGY